MTELQDILAGVPIFSFLGRPEIAAVEELFVESTHQKGDYICREGEEGHTFHIILDGELEVVVGKDAGARVLAVLKKGDFFGEMALLQGGKRTASVIATRRARLVTLDRTSFNSLFLKNPKALEYFTRVLCKRIADSNKGEAVRGSTMSITVAAASPGLKGKTMLAAGLAAVLHDLTGAEILTLQLKPSHEEATGAVAEMLSGSLSLSADAANLIQKNAVGISTVDIPMRSGEATGYYAERASNIISKLSDRYPFLIFDLDAALGGAIEAIPMFSDVLVEVVESITPLAPENKTPGQGMKTFRVINKFNPGSQIVPISHCEPFVLPRHAALSNGHMASFIRKNMRSAPALPVYRLARKILGSTVGIALGGGAAFGIAHIGVLKVLEENGIPIDLVAGCSQGSIIAVGYAAGVTTADMVEIALRLGKRKNSFLAVDLTLTRPGILAGERFVRIFEPLLGTMSTFDDLVMPCQTVATDIESGERVAIGTGSLTTAFRASASVPMVFAPVRRGESVLVDGGVSDPVPAEVVNAMGADLCIAVNVVPPLKRGVENAVAKAVRNINRFNPMSYFGGGTDMPTMFDIIMNSMQVLQYELGNFKAISADVLINPELSDFTWIEYYRSAELIQRGVEAAEHAMPAITRAYAQKLAPFRKRS
jgi:NTE family protein